MNNMANFFNNLKTGLEYTLNVTKLGKIISFNSSVNTAQVELLHNVPNQNIPYQPIINVPVGYFNMGGYSIKVRPKVGDIVIVLFSDHDLDNILMDGRTKSPNTDRSHALEDGIALPLSLNFFNDTFNSTEDLTIKNNNNETYIKIQKNGDVIISANKIKLGENANKRILLSDGRYGTPSDKVFSE